MIFKETPRRDAEKRDTFSTGWQHGTAPLAAAGTGIGSSKVKQPAGRQLCVLSADAVDGE